MDEQDQLVDQALYNRYALNAKRVRRKRMFDRQRAERRLESQNPANRQRADADKSDIAEKIKALNNHFMNR